MIVYYGMYNSSEDLKYAVVNNMYIFLINTGYKSANDAIDAVEKETKNEYEFLIG